MFPRSRLKASYNMQMVQMMYRLCSSGKEVIAIAEVSILQEHLIIGNVSSLCTDQAMILRAF